MKRNGEGGGNRRGEGEEGESKGGGDREEGRGTEEG
jgi:hypothetical protein